MSLNFSTFPLGPLVISVGGIFLLTGFIASCLFLIKTTKNRGLSVNFLSNNLIPFLLIPILFGRIGSFIYLFSSFGARIDCQSISECIADLGFFDTTFKYIKYFFMVWDGGLDPTWMVFGFLGTFIIMALIKKEPLMKWLDAFVSPAIIFVIFIHIGGFFNAWGYGKPVGEDFPFSISYDLQNVRYSGPLYPVQLYGAILFIGLFFVGLKICKKSLQGRSKWKAGTFFGVMTFQAALLNGFLEFFRGDGVKMVFGDSVRLPQLLSFFLAFLTLIFLAFYTHEKYELPSIKPDSKDL